MSLRKWPRVSSRRGLLPGRQDGGRAANFLSLKFALSGLGGGKEATNSQEREWEKSTRSVEPARGEGKRERGRESGGKENFF